MAAITALHARCGNCKAHARHEIVGDANLGPGREVKTRCTVCHANGTYRWSAEATEERRRQAESRRRAGNEEALARAKRRDDDENWAILAAELQGLGDDCAPEAQSSPSVANVEGSQWLDR